MWKGASVITMAKEMRSCNVSGLVIAVDTWLGAWDHWCSDQWYREIPFSNGWPQLYYKFLSNVLTMGVENFVVPLPLDSTNAAVVLKHFGIVPDLIHLDAAHDYEAVARDLRAWWPLLRPGGIFIGDDYFPDNRLWPEVRAATDDFLVSTRHGSFEHQEPKYRVVKA